MQTLHFDSYTKGRAHLKELLDAAEQGRVATMQRDGTHAVIVDADRLQHFLQVVCPSQAQLVSEADGWSLFIPGLPIASDAATVDEAIEEAICALREYAEDWQGHLLHASNHRENWGLVQLIALSSDEQLRDWLLGTPPTTSSEDA